MYGSSCREARWDTLRSAVQAVTSGHKKSAPVFASNAELCSVVSDSFWPPGLQPTRLLCLWASPGKSTGVDCHFLPQGIFPTHGWIQPESPLLQPDSLPLSHRGSPESGVGLHTDLCNHDLISKF